MLIPNTAKCFDAFFFQNINYDFNHTHVENIQILYYTHTDMVLCNGAYVAASVYCIFK